MEGAARRWRVAAERLALGLLVALFAAAAVFHRDGFLQNFLHFAALLLLALCFEFSPLMRHWLLVYAPNERRELRKRWTTGVFLAFAAIVPLFVSRLAWPPAYSAQAREAYWTFVPIETLVAMAFAVLAAHLPPVTEEKKEKAT